MSFTDARQNRTISIGAVVTVHAALGYALLTGLAYKVLDREPDPPLRIYEVPIEAPRPPKIKPLPKLDKAPPRSSETLTAPPRELPTRGEGPMVITAIDEPGPIEPIDPGPGPAILPQPPPAPSLARGVAPRGNQGDWFPQDSYPAAARRANAEGRVSVRVTVGTDGRVSDCTVTASSGNGDLDATTCRLARRNGRFEPARDAAGEKVASSLTLRNVRWLLQ